MNYRFNEIISRILLTWSILTLSLGIEGIHGMDSPKIDIREIMVNGDGDSMEYASMSEKTMEFIHRQTSESVLSSTIKEAAKYYTGYDVDQNMRIDRNLDTAEVSFKEAALWGHTPSSIFLQAIQGEKESSIVSPLVNSVRSIIIYTLEGNLVAQYDLGYLYYNGQGVPQNYEIAEKWFSHVVSHKSDSHSFDEKDAIKKAHFLLAKMYHQGMGVVADSKKATQYLEMPASELYPISQSTEFYISFLKHGSRDKNLTLYANYFILFVFEANNGNVDLSIERNSFQYCEEISYFVKNFPLNEIKKSNFTIFEYDKTKKMKIGHLFLGMCKTKLSNKLSDQSDYDACILFLLIANNFQNRDSMDLLKKIKNNKTYLLLPSDDFSNLKKTLAIAVGRNTQGASMKSSEKSQKPSPNTKSVTQSSSRNVKTKKEVPVASQGKILNTDVLPIDESTNPKTILGLKYLRGDVVKQDYRMAEQLFKQAAEDGDIEAQSKLGGMYFLGLGVDKSVDAALVYLIPAADKGDAEAQNMLGSIYVQGLAGTQDINKSIKYFTLAADQGLEQAKGNLENLKISLLKHYATTGENSPKKIILNDISEKSQKLSEINSTPTNKDNGPKEQAIPILQASKKTATENEKKDVAISSKRNRKLDRHVSESVSVHNNTSPVSVKEEKLPEIKRPQKADTVEIKDDTYGSIQNNSFPVSDSADLNKKVKKKGHIKIPKAVKKWVDKRSETKEKKEKKKKMSSIAGSEKTVTEESSCISSSFADSDGKSHISVSISESEMSEYYIEDEGQDLTLNQQITCDLMKENYLDLYKFINKSGVDNINQLKFNSHRLIKKILLQMIGNNVIEMGHLKCSKIGAKVVGNKIGDGNVKCVIHATHALWYKDSDKIKHFFEFIAKSDSLIYDFLKIYFGENCFPRDLTTRVNTNNNSPSGNDNKGNESKPD